MKDIIQSLKDVHKLAESQMPFIRSEIEKIVKAKSKEIKKIEEFLDVLLDYQFMGIGEKEFKQLNKYYGTFDKEARLDWERMQKELLKEN